MGDMGVPHVQPWNTKEGRSTLVAIDRLRHGAATTGTNVRSIMDLTLDVPTGFMPDHDTSQRRTSWIARTLGMTVTTSTQVTSPRGEPRNRRMAIPTPGGRYGKARVPYPTGMADVTSPVVRPQWSGWPIARGARGMVGC